MIGNHEVARRYEKLSTPLIADACLRAGRSLRDQLRFTDYLEKRAKDSAYTLRKHLVAIGGAIET